MAVIGLIAIIGGTISGMVLIGAMLLMDLGLACVILGGVLLAASLLVLIFKVKETSGVELSTVDAAVLEEEPVNTEVSV